MNRLFTIVGLILVFAMVAMLAWVSNQLDVVKKRLPAKPVQSQVQPLPPTGTSSPAK